MAYLIGLDAGTTNQKAILFYEDGTIVAQASCPTKTLPAPDGGAVYDPAQLWEAMSGLLRKVTAAAGAAVVAQIKGIAVTGMGEAGLLLDEAGEPLCPIMAWFDIRPRSYTKWWAKKVGENQVVSITGMRPQYIFSANKLLWLQEHLPEHFRRAWKWACVEDYIAFRLCGELKMDVTIASRTMLMDLSLGNWSPPLLDAVGLRQEQLPELVPSGAYIGEVTEGAARCTGLLPGTPVFAGGHDHICGALACGILGTDRILDSSGTAEELLLVSSDIERVLPLGRDGFNVGRYAKPGQFYMAGGIPASGASVDWFRDQFGAVEEMVPGAHGLLFLPHLRGSSSPERDACSRGAYLGIRSEHAKADFAQAIYEGLGFELRLTAERLLRGEEIQKMVAIGGGTKNRPWLQTKADILGVSIEIPVTREATALGAALLAGIGADVYKDAEDAVRRTYRVESTAYPRQEYSRLYEKMFKVYKELYRDLRPVYQRFEEVGV